MMDLGAGSLLADSVSVASGTSRLISSAFIPVINNLSVSGGTLSWSPASIFPAVWIFPGAQSRQDNGNSGAFFLHAATGSWSGGTLVSLDSDSKSDFWVDGHTLNLSGA